jgi:hypothetical protein
MKSTLPARHEFKTPYLNAALSSKVLEAATAIAAGEAAQNNPTESNKLHEAVVNLLDTRGGSDMNGEGLVTALVNAHRATLITRAFGVSDEIDATFREAWEARFGEAHQQLNEYLWHPTEPLGKLFPRLTRAAKLSPEASSPATLEQLLKEVTAGPRLLGVHLPRLRPAVGAEALTRALQGCVNGLRRQDLYTVAGKLKEATQLEMHPRRRDLMERLHQATEEVLWTPALGAG